MRHHLQRWSRRWRFAPIRLSPVCHHHRLHELDDAEDDDPSVYPLVGVGWLVGMSWWQDGERSASAGTVPGSVALCGSGGRPHLQPTYNAPRRVSHIFQANYIQNRLAMGLWFNIMFTKDKVTHAHAMKMYRGKSCLAPVILKTRHCMQAIDLLQAPAASTPGNNLVNRRRSGPHNRFGRFGE